MGKPADVRFGSLADICAAKRHVRFTPNSGRKSGHVWDQFWVGYWLEADTRHAEQSVCASSAGCGGGSSEPEPQTARVVSRGSAFAAALTHTRPRLSLCQAEYRTYVQHW